jgi:hypothetical protein
MARRVKVVGVGGSLRAESTSRSALEAALDGAASSGASVELIWVRDLDLPFYTAERAIPAAAHQLAETAHDCDAMIWSSPTYHGSVSGSFKRARLADPAGRPHAALPVEQADWAGEYGWRSTGAAGRQFDGLHRPCTARLERPARAASAAFAAVV